VLEVSSFSLGAGQELIAEDGGWQLEVSEAQKLADEASGQSMRLVRDGCHPVRT
jgi:hypothetical protein